MSRIQGRGSIALAAVALALLPVRTTDAQALVLPSPREPKHAAGPWVTGSQHEIVNKAMAEHRLHKLQAKLRRDAERGDTDAVGRDVRRIEYLRYRIAVDVWLIRKLAQQDSGYYPLVIDESSLADLAMAARAGPDPAFPQFMPTPVAMTATPTISITIANDEPAGAGVAFAIDGIPHQAAAGSRQDLAVAPGSSITYDGGGSIGRRRYQLSPGVYEFRSTAEGWAFYKVTGIP